MVFGIIVRVSTVVFFRFVEIRWLTWVVRQVFIQIVLITVLMVAVIFASVVG